MWSTCFSGLPEMGNGRIVAESTSPVGRGTAGLLLINGYPLLSGIMGLVAGNIAVGAGLGEVVSLGLNGQGNAGEDDTMPPPVLCGGAAADFGGCWSGKEGSLSGGETGVEDTFTANFCPSKQSLLEEPLLKEK